MTPEGLRPSDKAAGQREQFGMGMTHAVIYTWYTHGCILPTEIYNFPVEAATSYARTIPIIKLNHLSLTVTENVRVVVCPGC